MNNSYVNYFKNRMPMKILSSIFRYYKKSYEAAYKAPSTKRNCSAPPLAARSITGCSAKLKCRSDYDLKRPEVEQSPKSKSTSNVETTTNISRGLKEKLEMLDGDNSIVSEIYRNRDIKSSSSSLGKKSYPWQHFDMQRSKYKNIKSIDSVTNEFINRKKSSLKKQSTSKMNISQKEVRYDRARSSSRSGIKRAYPWQNFNLENIAEPQCHASVSGKKNFGKKFDHLKDDISYKQLDLNIREKIEKLIDNTTEICRIRNLKALKSQPSVSRAYPWQNFNLESIREPEYRTIRQINSVANEFMNKKYSSKQYTVVETKPKKINLEDKSTVNIAEKNPHQRNNQSICNRKQVASSRKCGVQVSTCRQSVKNKKMRTCKMT